MAPARRDGVIISHFTGGRVNSSRPTIGTNPHSRNAALPLPLFPINLTLIAAAPCLSTGN
jgi:hypothetical protein